jgi:D-amino-acid dehydrogenase
MKLVVVGSGVVGSACAHAACELGAEVVLVDAELPGKATAAGAGIICPWSSRVDDEAWYAFACAAAREYPALVAGLADSGAVEVSYKRVGALLLAASAEHAELIAEQMIAKRERAPEIGDVQVLDGEQARMLFPPLRAGSPAVFVGGAARVDGRRIAAAMAAAATSRGMVTRTGRATLVREAESAAGQVRGVLLDGELIAADAVVAAAGAWTREFLEPSGVTVRVTAERGQIMHISMGAADTSDWPVVLPLGSGHYLLAFDDSRVVVGATREADAGFDYRVTPDGLREVLTQALSVAPGLGPGSYLETRVGFRPVGPDGRPLLGAVAGVPGLVVATGLGASGLTMGPYAGAIAAKVALGKEPGIDLSLFDPVR